METKFTKGEWIREKTTVYSLHQIGLDKGKAMMSNRFYLQVYPDYRVENCPEEAEANAKLIAAAPDLFNELLEIAEMAYSRTTIDISDEQFKRIENVLKKATE